MYGALLTFSRIVISRSLPPKFCLQCRKKKLHITALVLIKYMLI